MSVHATFAKFILHGLFKKKTICLIVIKRNIDGNVVFKLCFMCLAVPRRVSETVLLYVLSFEISIQTLKLFRDFAMFCV